MRLLYYTSDGELNWTKDFIGDDKVPPYAILSHTWQNDQEVTFSDLINKNGKGKTGYNKIRFCAQQAERDRLHHFWVDTCCIDKSNHVELQNAINSMFRWYQNAIECYVYLSDVSLAKQEACDELSDSACESAFRTSRWFTRGWTLQELIAPRSVKFFTQDGRLLGDKNSLLQKIHEITGIPIIALQGTSLQEFSVKERMSWTKRRTTTYKEDRVYSLLGIFGVYMLPNYGEGEEHAFKRLQKELEESPAEIRGDKTAANLHWIVPRKVNSLFTGRVELVNRIRNAFSVDERRKTSEQKRFVVTGIGGQGKSEVCLKVANLMREEFWGVFWVDVDSYTTAKNDFMAVAKALGSSAESINESLQALANTKKRWLLVLDNADDPGFDYATYIPSGAQGAVIITSRVPDCGRYSTIGSEALEGLDLQHSTQLLLKAARVPEKSWLCCKTQAQDVVVLLGSHTLALIQAGAYIAEGYCELAQYPKKFQQQRKRLLKHHPEQEQSRYRDIYTTFEASADVLEHAKGEAGTDALDLLAILSMLHSSLLPLEVFADAWTGARRVHQAKRTETDEIGAVGQQHVSRLPELVSMETDEWDDYRLKRASALLASLSLVTRHCLDGFDGLTMHPLAHAWAKDRLGKERQQQAWVSVGCLLALSRRHSETWHTSERESKMWEMYERELRPHLQSFLLPGLKTAFSYEPQKVILPIILKCGWALNAMREDNGLQSLLEGLHWDLQITQSNPSEEHLPIWDLTARNLRYMGKTRHAVALLEHVIKVRKTTLAETHPDRLASQHELARAYKAHGQIKEAIELLEHTVKVQKTTLAEPHPNQLHSQHELAGAYMANGQIKEAVELLEHVVRVRRTSLAETHPDQLASQNNLANAYEANGQIKEAVELLEHVVRIRKTSLVETHSDRLVSQNNLANAYRANGQIKEAVELLEHVVGVRKASLAETHPDRLVSQHALASAYQANGQIKEAIELLEHVVRVRRTSLAETHPDQLASQNNLANAYEANGQIKEAVELLEHVVGVRKASLAETHPDRLVSQHALASAYQANGQIKEAIELLEHVVEVEKTTLAETHPDRLVSQHNLASAYKANGQIEEALELIEHVVKVQKTTLAETHPSRQLSERMLLSILRARDRRARDRRARFS